MIRGIFFDLGWTLELPETGDWMLTKCFRKYISEELHRCRICARIQQKPGA